MASSLPRGLVEWQQFGSRFWQWMQGKIESGCRLLIVLTEAIQMCNCLWITCELLCVLCHFSLQVQCLPHAYVPTVPNSVHPPPQPAAQRERQVWLWAGAAQAVPEAAQSAAGPALRAPVRAEQLQGQQCAQLPHHTGPHGGQTQRNRKDRESRRERLGKEGRVCTNLEDVRELG